LGTYTLFYLPGASVLRYLPVREKQGPDHLLAFGNPQVEGVSSLRFAAREAETIAQLYGTQPYLGGQATESRFKAQAEEYSLIHLAAHSQFNPHNPLYSSLRLAAGDGEDGRLEVHEVYGLDLAQADLVTLSACQTQMGRLAGGDELIGLQRAFLYAGAPSVVASLWSVDDQATGVLMEHFYRNLRQGMGKAEALRQAQLAMMEEYPDPYYWAAFQLTGDYGGGVVAESAGTGNVGLWLLPLIVPLLLAAVLGSLQRRQIESC
jgi:CHAT domain-containing protein